MIDGQKIQLKLNKSNSMKVNSTCLGSNLGLVQVTQSGET